ncbi:MAG: acetyl-CoA C-acetyltransferase [Desulfonatronovibrionaceae bacterium]
MREVVIAGYLRTPFSRSKPKDPSRDVFSLQRADELLALLLPELIKQTDIDPQSIEDFIIGCALGVNEQWTYGGRTPLFLANLSPYTPAKFMDQQCGSSMAALHTGYLEIAGGFADTVLVAGMEHMTRVPIGPKLYSSGWADINPDLFHHPGYTHWDMQTTMNMGLTAEKLAKKTNISREEMDSWGVRSHKLAARALKDGFFDQEILPVPGNLEDGQQVMVDRDQCIRPDASMEGMSSLKPAFQEHGVITAGNASPLNAGASAMLLMSADRARQLQINSLAAIRSLGFAAVHPAIMGEAPVPAARRALKCAGLSAQNIDFWEINEAFNVVVLNMIQELELDPEKVNIKGGAAAIGHAMGATGIRITGTLARILDQEKANLGCAAACIGGGQGTATIIERI